MAGLATDLHHPIDHVLSFPPLSLRTGINTCTLILNGIFTVDENQLRHTLTENSTRAFISATEPIVYADRAVQFH